MDRRIHGNGFESAGDAASATDKRVCGRAAKTVWHCDCAALNAVCGMANAALISLGQAKSLGYRLPAISFNLRAGDTLAACQQSSGERLPSAARPYRGACSNDIQTRWRIWEDVRSEERRVGEEWRSR